MKKEQELTKYADSLYYSNMSGTDIEKAMIEKGADEELAKETRDYIEKSREMMEKLLIKIKFPNYKLIRGYSAEQIQEISFDKYMALIAKELNDEGFRVKNNRGEASKYSPDEFLIDVDVIKDENALNYLKRIKLIDNGRCPKCGNVMNKNKYTFTNRFNPNASYYICKSCYNKGLNLQRAFNPSSNNKGCLLFILLLIISSCCILSSCREQRKASNAVVSENNSQVKSTDTDNSNPLPEGYSWGQAKPYVGKNAIEKNIIRESSNYYNALLNGDIDKAVSYFYPDVIAYNKKLYPDDFADNNDVTHEIIKYLSDNLINLNKDYNDYGMETDFMVCNIDKIIETDEAILCVFGVTTQVYYEKSKGEKYFHSTPSLEDYQIGVSFNKGKDWTFMTLTEDTPNILQLRFSKSVINKIIK